MAANHSHHNKKGVPLGVSDFIASGLLFLLIAVGVYELLGVAVPGLFKFDTLLDVIYSGVVFLAVWMLFGNSLFKDYFDVLERREDKTLGAEELAAKARAETRERTARVEEEIKLSRLAGVKLRDELVEEAKKRAGSIRDAASSIAREELTAAETKLAVVRKQALEEGEVEAGELAKLVIERALVSEKPSAIH